METKRSVIGESRFQGPYLKIVAYGVATGGSAEELIREVQDMMKRYWQPQGGISVVLDVDSKGEGVLLFAQAMVMFDPQQIVPVTLR